MILDGCVVLATVLEQAMRRRVSMDQEFGMPVVFAFMHVLGRGHRQQADSQTEHTREDPGQPHT